MNGLLLKDWISLRRALLGIAGMLVVCTALFVPLGVSSLAFLIPAALVVLLPVHAMSLDVVGRWERYALALPLSRREILAARYQFSLLCLGAVALFCGAVAVVSVMVLHGFDLIGVSPLIWWAGCIGVALLMLDMLLAVFFVYRVNVGILLFLVLCLTPPLVVYFRDLLTPEVISSIALVTAAAGLLGLWVSWRVALRAFERWDVV